jgi:hypothetical protein
MLGVQAEYSRQGRQCCISETFSSGFAPQRYLEKSHQYLPISSRTY